jgi:Na+-transporting methylmalonyl-CoA/oxaloacetate decarboxylase gamma subunit
MSLIDALVITALGMSVVFIGLILTALLITSFGLVARFQEARSERSQAVAQPTARIPAGPVDDATLAVIWTVLEVERRLNRGGFIRPTTPPAGGSERSS